MKSHRADPAANPHPASVARRRGRLLQSAERAAVLELLFQGWGKVRACRELGFSYDSFLKTRDHYGDFAEQVIQACEGQKEAVEMALYKAALEGDVGAQKYWLQNSPAQQPSADEDHSLDGDDDLSQLTDEQLIERARAVGIDLPPAIAQRLAASYRVGRSDDVSPPAED